MNGWMRLWVVTSSVWIIVIVFSIFNSMPHEPSNATVFAELDEKTKLYFEGLLEEPPQLLPSYEVELKFVDGNTTTFKHTLMTESEIISFRKNAAPKLIKYAEDNYEVVSEDLMQEFIDETVSLNILAGEAMNSYENEVIVQMEKLNSTWFSEILESLILLIFLPLISFLLGHSFAWIRRGFESH